MTQDQRAVYADCNNFRYAARFRLRVQHPLHLGMKETERGAEGTIALANGLLVDLAIDRRREVPWLPGSPVLATLLAFRTRTEAESAGNALHRALLWTSVARNFPVMIEPYGVDDFELYDRSRSEGASVIGVGVSHWTSEVLASEIEKALTSNLPWSDALQLSMELLVGSRLEASERARFVVAVSAIEPLLGAHDSPPLVRNWVGIALASLEQVPISTPDEQKLMSDLRARIGLSARESRKAAVKRVVSSVLPEKGDEIEFAVRAYDLRSSIVHEGAKPQGLFSDYERFCVIMRRIYAERLKLPLP